VCVIIFIDFITVDTTDTTTVEVLELNIGWDSESYLVSQCQSVTDHGSDFSKFALVVHGVAHLLVLVGIMRKLSYENVMCGVHVNNGQGKIMTSTKCQSFHY